MKNQVSLFYAIFMIAFLTQCSQNQENISDTILYESPEFTINRKSIRQGNFSANVLSNKEITSDYKSSKEDSTDTTVKTWKLSEDISAYPNLATDIPLVDALYNLSLEEVIQNTTKEGLFNTGKEWSGVWTRDISYSVLLALAITHPEISKASLRKKVRQNRIVQDTGTGGSYPISSDRMTWALGAWELYKITGDSEWLKESFEIIKNSMDDDVRTVFSETGMIKGESSFLDWREQSYPDWMNPKDIYASENLGTIAVHYQTLKILTWMGEILSKDIQKYQELAENMKIAINEYLWQEDKGFYGQFLYGKNYLSLSPKAEALGEAHSILFGIADENQARKITENTPLTAYGIPCFYPQIPEIQPYHNNGIWPFVQAFWNWAVAKTGNEKALEHGLASMYRAGGLFLTNKENMVAQNGDYQGTAINSDRQLWSVAGNLAMTYRIFFGMEFTANRLKFNPVIPKVYAGTKRLENFKYRNGILDIEITGYGNQIKSFKLDGKELQKFEIADIIEGKHALKIEMANNHFKLHKINLVYNQFTPKTPRVFVSEHQISWETVPNIQEYEIYRNGQKIAKTDVTTYPIEVKNYLVEYQVKAIDNQGFESFLTHPIAVYSDDAIIEIEIEKFAQNIENTYKTHKGTPYVRISEKKSEPIDFEVNITQAGTYFIDFLYANGNGPINTENKCAIRSLSLNNQRIGTVVFPQQGTGVWDKWDYSNAYAVKLEKGIQKFRLSFEESDKNMNEEGINEALIDQIRLIKKE